MRRVSELMSQDVVTLHKQDNLKQGRHLMRDLDIQHIPILDDSDAIVGLLTERIVLSAVFRLINMHGSESWKDFEEKILIVDIMSKDVFSVGPETPLTEACQYFINNKHGALPVIELNKVVGIVTAADFVKLSLCLLENNNG